eukprot:jgi/Tetstr1/454195/TSEL_041114.t1
MTPDDAFRACLAAVSAGTTALLVRSRDQSETELLLVALIGQGAALYGDVAGCDAARDVSHVVFVACVVSAVFAMRQRAGIAFAVAVMLLREVTHLVYGCCLFESGDANRDADHGVVTAAVHIAVLLGVAISLYRLFLPRD